MRLPFFLNPSQSQGDETLCILPSIPFFHKHLPSTHSKLRLILGTRLTEMNKILSLPLGVLSLVRESAMWAWNDHTVQSTCQCATKVQAE